MDFNELFDRRVMLITGKGGTGRTSVSAALGLAAAGLGRRVLLLEIGDPEGGGSPLAQLFGRERFTHEPHLLAPNLRACHLWAPRGHQLFLKAVLPGGALLGAAMRSKALQSFLRAAPSFLEMGWFYHLLTLMQAERQQGEYEHQLIILDMPATGHTLALTSLGDTLHRLIRRGPIIDALAEGQAFLNDPGHTAAWVVTLPEQLPVSEALELLQGLKSTEVPVGGLILNRIPNNPFTERDQALVEQVLQHRALLGSLAFRRIIASQEAERRLRHEVDLPVVSLPEEQHQGQPLVLAMARQLSGLDPAQEVAG